MRTNLLQSICRRNMWIRFYTKCHSCAWKSYREITLEINLYKLSA